MVSLEDFLVHETYQSNQGLDTFDFILDQSGSDFRSKGIRKLTTTQYVEIKFLNSFIRCSVLSSCLVNKQELKTFPPWSTFLHHFRIKQQLLFNIQCKEQLLRELIGRSSRKSMMLKLMSPFYFLELTKTT